MTVFAPVAVRCVIARGGFSGERIVTVRCADGTDKKGLAPTRYCWNDKKHALGEDEPADGATIEGFVAARKLRGGGPAAPGGVVVDIPDGEVMVVPLDSVIPRPTSAEPETASHVPLGP
jgi:hypothetical protein